MALRPLASLPHYGDYSAAGIRRADRVLGLNTLAYCAVETDPSKGWGTPAELGVVFGSEDAMEGAMAFMEKRSPNWKSR